MLKLVCSDCGKEYSDKDPVWRCSCGGILDLINTPGFKIDKTNPEYRGMWRYRDSIPVNSNSDIISFQEGFTPLLEIDTTEGRLLVKQDHLFPTGSYKDRGASVLISKIKELGIKKVVEDSSGNAGAAVAAYCAKAGIECDIYVPESTSSGKLAQIELYGAKLHRIPGTRENTAMAVMEAAEKIYYASHSWNPWFFQGTKTFAYEVCEQLGWKTPDIVVLPAGNGTLFLGAYIGFRELKEAGIITDLPKMIAVQSANCAPLYKSYLNGSEKPSKVESVPTLAEGIAIAEPVRGTQILNAVQKTNGTVVAVNEEDILLTLKSMIAGGYYIEPTSGAVIAGALNYQKEHKEILKTKIIVTAFTGHGLKSTEKLLNLDTGY